MFFKPFKGWMRAQFVKTQKCDHFQFVYKRGDWWYNAF